MRFLPNLLKKAIKKGNLVVVDDQGQRHSFGEDGAAPHITVRINDPSLDWKIFLNPELKGAEAYMDGTLEIVEGDVYGFLELFYINRRHFDMTPNQVFWNGLARRVRRLQQHNPVSRARANVKHHYDLGDDLFKMFLDKDMQYSCAYFPAGNETLEEAQLAKKRHIAAKLNLQPGQKVLDIGCGWGGMALYLAKIADVNVTGITLSDDQMRIATQRATEAGLSHCVSFRLQDYREIASTYDRVVSVGMLEHVGVTNLQNYFMAVRDHLSPDGVALIHSISGKSPPGVTGPFIRKYIFPGGYSPSVSEMMLAVEQSGLWALDIEIWRKHYGYTLREWRNRFEANRQKAVDLYDERFARMWEFYLAACEGVFMHGSSHVAQIQLGRERDSVPISRDYLMQKTEEYKRLEQERGIS